MDLFQYTYIFNAHNTKSLFFIPLNKLDFFLNLTKNGVILITFGIFIFGADYISGKSDI